MKTVLVTGQVVGQHVLRDVFEKLSEDVEEHQEVDAFRQSSPGRPWRCVRTRLSVTSSIFSGSFQTWSNSDRYVRGERRLVNPVDEVGDCVAGLVAEVNGGKSVQGLIDGLPRISLKADKLLHRGFAAVRAEGAFRRIHSAHSLAIALLGELILELDFEFAAVEATLAFGLWDVELASNLAVGIGHFVRHEGGRREDKLERVQAFSSSAFSASNA